MTLQILPFEEHYRTALHDLRIALTELLVTAGADPANPQETARRFGLNRNLTWKVSRMVRDTNPFSAYPHMPGAAAIEILIVAFGKAGASRATIEAVRKAVAEFDRMVRTHAGDRATLELMLDGVGASEGVAEPLEVSRKLAFRGNSGIWGAQAKVRLRSVFLAPNRADPSQLDLAQISGLVGLRRFRSNAVWPLFRHARFQDDGSEARSRAEPLFEQKSIVHTAMLIEGYSSSPLPDVRVVEDAQSTIYELAEGPLGNHGSTTLVYGNITRCFAPRYREDANIMGECITEMNAPSEHLLFDVFVHRDVASREQFEARTYQGEPGSYFARRSPELPSNEAIQDLGSPPLAATTLFPPYRQLVDDVFERLEWNPRDFRGLRLEMKYPPVPAISVLRYPLPEGPG